MDLLRGIPQDVILVVIVGAVLLFQLVLKLLRRRATAGQQTGTAQAEADNDPAVAAAPAEILGHPPAVVPQPAPATAAPKVARRSAHGLRRGARAALFQNRRDLRSAVVAVAILQPCHAFRPDDLSDSTVLRL